MAKERESRGASLLHAAMVGRHPVDLGVEGADLRRRERVAHHQAGSPCISRGQLLVAPFHGLANVFVAIYHGIHRPHGEPMERIYLCLG